MSLYDRSDMLCQWTRHSRATIYAWTMLMTFVSTEIVAYLDNIIILDAKLTLISMVAYTTFASISRTNTIWQHRERGATDYCHRRSPVRPRRPHVYTRRTEQVNEVERRAPNSQRAADDEKLWSLHCNAGWSSFVQLYDERKSRLVVRRCRSDANR